MIAYLVAGAVMLVGCLLMVFDASFALGAWIAFAGVVLLVIVRMLGPAIPWIGSGDESGDGEDLAA